METDTEFKSFNQLKPEQFTQNLTFTHTNYNRQHNMDDQILKKNTQRKADKYSGKNKYKLQK